MNGESAHRFLFYSSEVDASSESIDMTGDEHHHITHVLRMPVGEIVYVTSGRGVIVRCRIEKSGRRATRLKVLGIEETHAPLRSVTLALAALRKEAFERAVEQCTQLGVTTCLPFVCERSHVKRYSAAFIDRLRRVAVSAAKQSFRPLFPEIESAIAFDELLPRVGATSIAVVGDTDGQPLERLSSGGSLMVIVGPEGGLTGSERAALAASGARFVSVSRNRLRSETAAVALVSVALAGGFAGDW